MTDSPAQVRLGDDQLEVVVLPELGGRLHRIRALDAEILWAPDDPAWHRDHPYDGGAYVMAPWANRIAPGRRRVADRELDLAVSFPDGTAIHGLVHSTPWQQTGGARFEVEAGRDPTGWPWRYRASLDVDLAHGDGRAEVGLTLGLENLDDGPMPGGIGLHPWFRLPVEVAIHADRVYHPIEDSPPTPALVSGELDQRALGPLPLGLDDAWVDLEDPPVTFRWPDRGLDGALRASVRLGNESRAPVVVAASLPRRAGVAVEAQTNAPQGLRRLLEGEPDGLVWIAPGARLELAMRLALRATR